ncbi:phage GP46 family protein [Oceanibacterium hippocampi]|uniref:Phage protein GP46 n=1 Tax=Oceanibacterium hippocampi TaxID=745714 RepID=A0A1Y5U5X9_9PROT|nr:phage GP46 family protein [Oceanibacterium hippocampi]SLN77621.1 Phage protein GP46 [Oceanibacterium hippocampi]
MDLELVFDGATLRGDLAREGRGLRLDGGLRTAVVLSLFTDARARADDTPPGGPADRRGWWGDLLLGPGDRIGSRLWLLDREKILPSTLARARRYAEEALAWLVEDGIARRVTVAAEVARGDALALTVRIERPDGSTLDYRFDRLWREEEDRAL